MKKILKYPKAKINHFPMNFNFSPFINFFISIYFFQKNKKINNNLLAIEKDRNLTTLTWKKLSEFFFNIKKESNLIFVLVMQFYYYLF